MIKNFGCVGSCGYAPASVKNSRAPNRYKASFKVLFMSAGTISEMPLGFQIRVSKQYCGRHNLPPLVGIGFTELQNSGWARV